MEPLYYEETLESPGIILDPDKNTFRFWGKSFPEEAKKFYEPILNWFDEYLQKPNDESVFEFRLDYYNSASATQILEILYLIEKLYNNNNQAKIIWKHLDIDDDMREAGIEYKEMVDVPIDIVSYVEEDWTFSAKRSIMYIIIDFYLFCFNQQ